MLTGGAPNGGRRVRWTGNEDPDSKSVIVLLGLMDHLARRSRRLLAELFVQDITDS